MVETAVTNEAVPGEPAFQQCRSAWRGVAFRLTAVGIGLSPLVLLEAILWLGGWAKPDDVADPYVGFATVAPLFVPDESGERFVISPGRGLFRSDSFSRVKGPREFRAFCLGGSTVQGRPYSIETAFSSWLELSLGLADPSRKWEFVNCGGISYASYRLVPILQEVLTHDPDLILLCTGHNEFLEDRTYANVKATPRWVAWAHHRMAGFRTYNLLRSWCREDAEVSRSEIKKSILPEKVEALLDYRGGLEAYHRDDARRAGVVRHFEFNLRRMVRLCQAAGVPLILMQPVSNLKDCPPFKVVADRTLGDEARSRFADLWARAGGLDRPLDERIALLDEAAALDSRHAGVYFRLGKLLEEKGAYVRARTAFLLAKDEDICPLRMIEPLHDVVAEVAGDTGTPLVDMRTLFAAKTADGIPGDEWLVDHVHPSIKGHQEIALRLHRSLERSGWVKPAQPGLAAARTRRFREHLQGLDAIYEMKARQELQGLRLWTKGRASAIRESGSARTVPQRK